MPTCIRRRAPALRLSVCSFRPFHWRRPARCRAGRPTRPLATPHGAAPRRDACSAVKDAARAGPLAPRPHSAGATRKVGASVALAPL